MAHSVEDVRRHYDGLSFGEFSYGDRRAGFYPLFDAFVATINPESRVVDVGCGAGFWLDEFVRRGVAREQLLGLDLAPANVQRARERGHRAEVGNVLDLAQPDAAFDAVFCAGVIHHTPDPRLAFRELVRITRPGGHIYLAVYNRWHPYYYLVHRGAAPLRYVYWHHTKKAADVAYRLARVAFQPLAWLALGRFLDDRTARTMFMDQVITPRAALFTKRTLRRYARECGCTVEAFRYNRYGLMLSALFRVS